MSTKERDELRGLQDSAVRLAERHSYDEHIPISEIQNGAPSIAELRTALHPEFRPAIRAFIEYATDK